MKIAIIELGASPSDEPCAQVGDADYAGRSRIECAVFRSQVLRHYPVPTGLENEAGVGIAFNPDEVGSYRVVDIGYDPFSVRASQWASQVATDPKGVLARWDEEARQALGLRDAVTA